MRKSAIIRIAIWSAVAIILISTMVSIMAMGGFSKFINTDWNYLVGFFGSTYRNADQYEVGNASLDAKDITEIQVNWVSGSVNVEVYDGETLEVSESAVQKDEYKLRYWVNGGRLIIQHKKSGYMFGVSKIPKKELTVKIPAFMTEYLDILTIDSVSSSTDIIGVTVSEKLKIDTVSGSVYLTDVTAAECDIDSVSGKLTAENLVVDEIDMDSVSGGVTANGAIREIDVDTTSGSIKIETSVMPGTVNIDTVSGSAKLTIPEDESGFTASIDAVSGRLNCDFPTISKGKKTIYGDGKAEFDFDTVSGNMTIKLK